MANLNYVPSTNLMGRGCLAEAGPFIAMKDACTPGNPFQPTKEEVIEMFKKIADPQPV